VGSLRVQIFKFFVPVVVSSGDERGTCLVDSFLSFVDRGFFMLKSDGVECVCFDYLLLSLG